MLFVIGLCILCLLISIGVLMYGWGLQPVNWAWIIGGPVVVGFLTTMIDLVNEK